VSGIIAIGMQLGRSRIFGEMMGPKLLMENSDKKKAPFIEATGARAGALLGDVRHDPFQSGGLGTPAHLRVEAGFIHKANGGVLFIDEASALSARGQQELLTAMQEKKYPITGQSELSSGAQVRTEPVPCDFVLVAAGNYRDLQRMHPALRSRIRGYGYEVYMEDQIDDTPENEDKIIQFIAQEVQKDGKIPHFDSAAVEEIIYEARKRSGRKNKLTLKLRELGGLIRAAGDLAVDEGAKLVSATHVLKAKTIAQTLEQQMVRQAVEMRKEYQVFTTHGAQVGKVNGLAVMGDSGVVLPIVAEVAPASSREEGKTIATGKLGDIAKEAVENVSALIKRHLGKDTSTFDIHIQFLQTYEGVEGDSASVSVATAVISALEEVAVKQDVALTGSLSIRGDVLPVGGITQKVEAAIEAGIKKAVVPYANKDDVVLSEEQLKKIELLTAKNIYDVLAYALKEGKKKNALLAKIKKEIA
ncbi:MAG: ATP-dependent protease LonB, partial [Candidatus Micrarchaeota archaeon]